MGKYKQNDINFIFIDNNRIFSSADRVSAEIEIHDGEDIWSSLDIPHTDRFIKEHNLKLSIKCNTADYSQFETSEQTKMLMEQLKQSLAGNLKTSVEWAEDYYEIILDPDGWDRGNYDYSWKIELITREEFEIRANRSTTKLRGKWKDQEEISV